MVNTTKKLAGSALFAALSVVFARLLGFAPTESMRFSLEAVPLFLGGLCFGPVYGAMIGFVSDFAGSLLFSAYGFSPIYCLPPILYGLCAGLFRKWLQKGLPLWKIAIGFLPPVVLGSILWQSLVLAYTNGSGENLKESYLLFLSARSIQFGITYILDVLAVWLLCRSNLFYMMGYLPKSGKGSVNHAENS